MKLITTRGFTLIELLIVISIIGILAGVVIGVIDPQRQRAIATDAVTQSTMNKFIEGIESYYSANGVYPSAADMTAGTVSFINEELKPEELVYTVSGALDIFYLCNVTMENPEVYFVYDSTVSQIFRCGTGQTVVNCAPYGCP
jgi:prepilin-type N-terminal cleavage/methylation domain-containing protein